MQGLLGTTLILLAACSLAAMATAAFRVPALLGYLSVGVVLGPSVIGVIAPGETLSFLSELGVALLLFMVGLEFSLGDFWLARRTVLMAGALQMIAVAPPLILLLMWLGQPGQSAALLGTAAAMSSTALVSRQLADQGELTTRHGRSAIAVLVFQDLASVPLLALLAIWARGESPKIEHVLLEVFGVLLLFAAAASPRAVCCMACWAGWHGGATRNRSCSSPCAWWWLPPPLRTRSAYPPPWGPSSPGWCWARATSGTTWKATSGRFAMCCRACSS